MAKNYTFNEAVKTIAKGTDLEAITDIGRRYPVLAHKIAVVAAKAGEEFVDLMGYMPDYLTANKVNKAIKDSITESEADEDTEVEATTKDTSEDATEANPYEGKSAMELFKECKARKIKAAPKKPAKYYIDLLVKDDAAKATEVESDDEDWGDEETETPKKKEKKAAKPAAKGGKAKAVKKAEVESEDDDDDWDI